MTSLTIPRTEGSVSGVMSLSVYLLAVGSSGSSISVLSTSKETRCRQLT